MAPDEYKKLSGHGGDEDWLVHIPKDDIDRGRVPFSFGDVVYGDEDSYLDHWGHVCHRILENGDAVIVFAHA